MRQGRHNSSGGGRFHGGGGRGNFNRGPREMHDATCSDCGGQCQVPFTPTAGRPVYCNACFQNHKSEGRPQRRDRDFQGSPARDKGGDSDSQDSGDAGDDADDDSQDDKAQF